MRKIVTLSGAAFLAAAIYAYTASTAVNAPGAVVVASRPVMLDSSEPDRSEVGRLSYRGGLVLESRNRDFGGLSGLRWTGDRLLAVSDSGNWVSMETREENGWLHGIGGVVMAPVLGLDGKPFETKRAVDAEALEIDRDGDLIVAFEMNHRVWRYAGMTARAEPSGFVPEDLMDGLPDNGAIEAMARLGDNRWVWLSEHVEAGPGSQVVLLDGDREPGTDRYTPPADYLPTDAAALDGEHLLVLGRRFSLMRGVGAMIELLPFDPETGQLGEAEPVAELLPPLTVDNMEGMTVRREGDRTYIYLISDDNFNPLQRTLLLKFELQGASGTKKAAQSHGAALP